MNTTTKGFTLVLLVGLIGTLAAVGADAVNCFVDTRNSPVVRYCPASTSNYRLETRAKSEINYVVIHTVQGSLESAVNTFSSDSLDNPRSAHYTIGVTGEVVKSVDPKYVAWHAGTSPLGSGERYESRVLNENSIGIEHEGFVDDPEFPNGEQYLTSAALTRYLCEKYQIPIDRQHIVGHDEIKSAKGDPGPNWDWDYFMNLVKYGTHEVPGVKAGAINEVRPAPVQQGPGFLSVVLIIAGLTIGAIGIF